MSNRHFHAGCILKAGLLLLLTTGMSGTVQAQQPRSYTDYRKEVVHFPLGARSFVDRVHSVREGTKKPLKTESDPKAALGEPDYQKPGDGRAFSLGCHGEATFEFTDNAIVDGPGPDLYIFEVGRDVEPTKVSLSNDGKTWEQIGEIAGGRTSIDLADYGLAGRNFRFVRLQDTGQFCGGRWPGADIDAIGAIGSAIRLRLESRVLFDFDKAELKSDASAALNKLVGELSKLRFSSLAIVGHTDARGSNSYNQNLSERRAQAVANYVTRHMPQTAVKVTASGRGELEPIESNETDEGRAANRRVEVIVFPN